MTSRLGLFAIALCALTGSRISLATELRIDMEWRDDGDLIVRYTPPPGVRELKRLRIDDTSNAVWAEHVKPANDCTTISADRVQLSPQASCTQAAVRVTPFSLARYAQYEPAYPLHGHGVVTYPHYFLMALSGHDLRWRWHAPVDGQVLFAGRLSSEDVDQLIPASVVDGALGQLSSPDGWRALAALQYVAMGRGQVVAVAGGVLWHDGSVGAEVIDFTTQTLARAMTSLSDAYGRTPAGPVGVVVSATSSPGFVGDVTEGRTMFLRLPGNAQASALTDNIQRFVPHEVAHWWNAGVFHSDHLQPWLHEGHADWVAWLLNRQYGVGSRQQALTTLETAFNQCALARGNRVAATLDTRFGHGDAPYACGMTLMVLAQVQHRQRQRGKPMPAPLVELASLHRDGETLGVSEFATWADGDATGPMHRLLQDPSVAFGSGLIDYVAALGIGSGEPSGRAASLPSSVAKGISQQLVQELMKPHCAGGWGFWSTDSGFMLDQRIACEGLRLGEEAIALNGISLTQAPVEAWRELAAQCAREAPSTAALVLGYRTGPSSTLICPAKVPPLPETAVIRLNGDALGAIGL